MIDTDPGMARGSFQTHCPAADVPLLIVVDEHLEERQGRQIQLKG